jgi:tagatose 1,6-diphosphate aldolase/sulfofructosephosphate aldolase
VQLRADRAALSGEPDTRAEVLEVIKEVVDDCRSAGIPSVIENLIFPLAGEEPPTLGQRADRIIAAAEMIDELAPDLIKLEYPGDAASCRRLAASIRQPWAVLSAGVEFERFADAVRVSCDEGGASGFIAGRSIWKESVGMASAERRAFLGGEGRRRLDALLTVIDGKATPIPA